MLFYCLTDLIIKYMKNEIYKICFLNSAVDWTQVESDIDYRLKQGACSGPIALIVLGLVTVRWRLLVRCYPKYT